MKPRPGPARSLSLQEASGRSGELGKVKMGREKSKSKSRWDVRREGGRQKRGRRGRDGENERRGDAERGRV